MQLPETLRPAVGSAALASLYGSDEQPVSAKLRLLSDAADPLTRTFEARYVLDSPLSGAPLGSTVTLHIAQNKASQPLLQVPLAAIFDAGKGPGVWSISGNPARVAWRPVQVVSLGDDEASVTGTLKPGEQVVALGAHLLHDGETVRLVKQSDVSVARSRP